MRGTRRSNIKSGRGPASGTNKWSRAAPRRARVDTHCADRRRGHGVGARTVEVEVKPSDVRVLASRRHVGVCGMNTVSPPHPRGTSLR